MKQKAAEWLVQEINKINVSTEAKRFINKLEKQAKEIEKQQQGYSEEDLREAFKQSRQSFIFEKDMPCVYDSFDEWFEQFKKK